MITESNVKRILLKDLNFDAPKIKKLDNFAKKLLIYNKKHNLISKNTENIKKYRKYRNIEIFSIFHAKLSKYRNIENISIFFDNIEKYRKRQFR